MRRNMTHPISIWTGGWIVSLAVPKFHRAASCPWPARTGQELNIALVGNPGGAQLELAQKPAVIALGVVGGPVVVSFASGARGAPLLPSAL
jgi:hypothetical protein